MHRVIWLLAQRPGVPLLPLLLVSGYVMLRHADKIVLFFCRLGV